MYPILQEQIMFTPFRNILALVFVFTAGAPAVETVTISGSSTVKPVVEAVADAYRDAHPDVFFFIRGGGSSIGIRDAGKHHVDIGMSSRPLKSFEKKRFKGLRTYRIGYDAVAFIAHKANKASNLEFEDIQEIYLGTTRNWEELGGSNSQIDPVSKRFGRATLDIFLYYFDLDAINSEGSKQFMQLKKQRHRGSFSSFRSRMLGSNPEVIDYVSAHPDALAYISFGEAVEAIRQNKPIKILSLDNVMPTPETIIEGDYPIRRDLNLIMYDSAIPLAKDFLKFATEGNGQKVIAAKGYLLKLR